MLLWLVRERPRHGYDLMAELTRLFAPDYRPSPGTIYPAVEALETEGLIVGSPVDGKVVYELTEPGDLALDARLDLLAAVEVRTACSYGSATASRSRSTGSARDCFHSPGGSTRAAPPRSSIGPPTRSNTSPSHHSPPRHRTIRGATHDR